jgi:ABC-type nitrate/sulfonate/bicarbonate transport system permease component
MTFNDLFIGFVFGLIIGSVLADAIWYLYFARTLYPFMSFVEALKKEQNLKDEMFKE